MTNVSEKKVAIVHDFLLYEGGAEKVLRDLLQLYPDAPLYTLLYDEEMMRDLVGDREVRTSFLQKWPRFFRKRHRFLLPFYGPAVEALDLREFDLVVSSSGAWTKGLVTRLDTEHVAYIHSPMRYVWDENEYYIRRYGRKVGFVARQMLSYLRVWDHQAAQRPDRLIANSQYTADRIKKYYRRESDVIYPAVDIEERQKSKEPRKKEDRSGFLIVSRLSAYKNVALAIEVCNKLQMDLTVVGTGPERSALEALAGEHITFAGRCDEDAKWLHLRRARAVLFPTDDDFGLVNAEALAAGTPVIALNRGGASEIIEDGVHGILFDVPVVEVMADGIRRFLEQEDQFDYPALVKRADLFSKEHFTERWHKIVG